MFIYISAFAQTNAPIYNALVSPEIIAGDITAETFNGVKVYRAVITQYGTLAPTATVLSNSIGEITWARDSVGVYVASIDSLFTIGKTYCSNNLVSAINGSAFEAIHLDANQIKFRTVANVSVGTLSDDIFLNTFIEIRVYP